jgi:hypothetical protein
LDSSAGGVIDILQVALNRFVDDIAVEVVEFKLVAVLTDLFSPIKVCDMDADSVAAIAGESEEDRSVREQLTNQLALLTKGAETCRSFIGNIITGQNTPDIRTLTLRD